MSDELKPCPFCGVRPELECSGIRWYVVRCNNHECSVYVDTEIMKTKQQAIEAWNKRHERTCKLQGITARLEGTVFYRTCSECECLTPAESFYCAHCGARVVEDWGSSK